MENFNTVPNKGTFGGSVEVINQNFSLAQQGMEVLQNKCENESARAIDAENSLRQLYNNLQQSQAIPVTQLPATGEAGKIYRLAGTNSYADYMYSENDLTTPIKMAEYDNAIDDEPTAGSDNLVKSRGVAEYYGSYTENPEYIEVKLDSESKIVEATREDGTKVLPSGVKTPKIEIDGATIENVENPEYIDAKTDAEGNILLYRNSQNILHEEGGIETSTLKVKKIEITGNDILSLYPKKRMIPILSNLKFGRVQSANRYTGFDGNTTIQDPYIPLSLLWFSDIHESEVNLQRIVRFFETYQNYIDDVLFTGDVVDDVYSDTIFRQYWKYNKADRILFTIGNHDALVSLSPAKPASPKACYNTYIKDYIGKTGVNSVENAAYWYKDYPKARSAKCMGGIRLISLDEYHWKEGVLFDIDHYEDGSSLDTGQQEAWFVNLLNDAREKGLAVMVALHGPCNELTDVDCSFNTFSRIINSYYATIKTDMRDDVQDFIDAGGEFITWITGHMHQDIVANISTHPDQTLISIGTASYRMMYRDSILTPNTEGMDRMNILSINPDLKHIRLHRIGIKYDTFGRHIGGLVYDYKNKKLISNY